MDTYTCQICGHVYDPEKGEPQDNIPPGSDFSKVPESWQCPVCGASKGKFARSG